MTDISACGIIILLILYILLAVLSVKIGLNNRINIYYGNLLFLTKLRDKPCMICGSLHYIFKAGATY